MTARGIIAITILAVISISFMFLVWYVIRNDRRDK